jgi:transcriptional regulator with XRE-family HTH domain
MVVPRRPAGDALESLLVSNSVEGWKFEAFRDEVLDYAKAAGIIGRPAIAVAAGVGPDMISKWFRGVGRPSDGSLRKLADAIDAPYPRLMWLAGLDPENRLGGADVVQIEDRPKTHPLVAELAGMLSPRSPLGDEDRSDLERLIELVIAPRRRQMRTRRKHG